MILLGYVCARMRERERESSRNVNVHAYEHVVLRCACEMCLNEGVLIHFYLITTLCTLVRCGGNICFAQWTYSSVQ